MAKDPAFLFYPGDYLRDTQTLSSNSQVAYDRIICEHMRNICISQKQLKFFTKRLSEDELEELMFVLIKVKGGYQIEWVAESIEKRRKYSKSRSENRKGKSNQQDNISTTYDSHMEDVNESEDVKEKGEGLIKDICDFFSVNEIKNFNAFSMLNAFVNISGIDSKRFNAYKEYKHISGEKIHGWQSFIGSRERGFEDGAWASCDWAGKIKDIPQQSNGIPSEPIGDEYNKWMRKDGLNPSSWMAACKIWKSNGYEYKTLEGSIVKTWNKIKQ